MIASALKRLFAPAPLRQQAHEAYTRIVAQARQPFFYHEMQIEDTLDGRFDALVLHLFLVIDRCGEEETPDAQIFVRTLSEVFFSDMDRTLREMGASDTGVGIRVKKMAQAFYGRIKAYHEAADDAALIAALRRNAYREKPVAEEAVQALAGYMRRARETLRLQPVDGIMQGRVEFS